ncbi:MAG: polysaccharide biosynthesis/export family protein [Deltaproteobacteria bacterium]|nr:polysaccharide biosynthesis/export family protein [Deltaproteobacteria bacterium]
MLEGSRLCLALVVALLACGCMMHIPPLPDDPGVLAPQAEYRIGGGDTLSVKLFYTAELNDEVTVRPDGRISLQLVGDVPVAGRTPEEVSQDLRERYAGHLTRPDVVVIVRGFGSQKAFVGGEVKSPSMIVIDGRTTLADAVFQAGGTLDTAALSSVILIRHKEGGRDVYRVDLSDGLEGEDPVPVLRPYDVVYVPKSFIAQVGMYVDLYVNRIIPKNAAFTAFYQVNPVGNPDLGAATGP